MMEGRKGDAVGVETPCDLRFDVYSFPIFVDANPTQLALSLSQDLASSLFFNLPFHTTYSPSVVPLQPTLS